MCQKKMDWEFGQFKIHKISKQQMILRHKDTLIVGNITKSINDSGSHLETNACLRWHIFDLHNFLQKIDFVGKLNFNILFAQLFAKN